MKITGKTGLLVFLICLLFAGGLEVRAQAGGAAVPFLLISPDARGSGMGEVGTAIADDINAVFWNPAGLAFHDFYDNSFDPEAELVPFRQAALSFSKWLPQFNADLYYSYGTIGQYFENLDGMLALNFTFMNLGKFTRTHESGTELGTFISNEFAVGLSYGTIIAKDLGVGVQLKYVQSNLAPATQGKASAGTGISGGFDLGLLWKPQDLELFGWNARDLLALGFNLQNIGPKMTYDNEADPLPTTLRLGIALHVVSDGYNDLTLAFDFSKLLVKRDELGSDPLPKSLITGWENEGAEFAFGMEYWYEQIVALRAGYFTEPSTLGGRQFWNFGFGVRYDIFNLDISYINTIEENHPLANTMRFSMLVDIK
ncbi:MAG: PorV/PorQ family protein [Chlorobi bacterium]|nr:PorV/PorQ family protein [Chlorobiota bacterium]